MLGLAVAACSHTASSPSAQINQGLARFSSTRNQAVGLVSSTKKSLGPEDLNTLAVAYTDLQEKANAYAGFMVEAINTSSFDPGRNSKYSAELQTAIISFDKAFNKLSPTHQTVAGTWVSPFAQSLQDRWDRYNGLIATMSPETKATLITDVKRNTVWPNYEDISTQPVVGSH